MSIRITDSINELIEENGIGHLSSIVHKLYDLTGKEYLSFAKVFGSIFENKGDESIVDDILTKEEASKTVSSVVSDVCKLSIQDLASVMAAMGGLNQKLGISTVSAGSATQSVGEAEAKAEQTSFKIKIINTDSMEKLNAVKFMKELLGVQIKEASDLLTVNSILTKIFNKDEAESVLTKLANFKVIAEKI